jgi:hypothetical protein
MAKADKAKRSKELVEDNTQKKLPKKMAAQNLGITRTSRCYPWCTNPN